MCTDPFSEENPRQTSYHRCCGYTTNQLCENCANTYFQTCEGSCPGCRYRHTELRRDGAGEPYWPSAAPPPRHTSPQSSEPGGDTGCLVCHLPWSLLTERQVSLRCCPQMNDTCTNCTLAIFQHGMNGNGTCPGCLQQHSGEDMPSCHVCAAMFTEHNLPQTLYDPCCQFLRESICAACADQHLLNNDGRCPGCRVRHTGTGATDHMTTISSDEEWADEVHILPYTDGANDPDREEQASLETPVEDVEWQYADCDHCNPTFEFGTGCICNTMWWYPPGTHRPHADPNHAPCQTCAHCQVQENYQAPPGRYCVCGTEYWRDPPEATTDESAQTSSVEADTTPTPSGTVDDAQSSREPSTRTPDIGSPYGNTPSPNAPRGGADPIPAGMTPDTRPQTTMDPCSASERNISEATPNARSLDSGAPFLRRSTPLEEGPCALCSSPTGQDRMPRLSCGHQVHAQCLLSARQRGRPPMCKVCLPDCPVCLNVISSQADKATLRPCQHICHLSCLARYIRETNTHGTLACPRCRTPCDSVNNATALPPRDASALQAARASTAANPGVRPTGPLPTMGQIIEASNNMVKKIPVHLHGVYIEMNREHLLRVERAFVNNDDEWALHSYVGWLWNHCNSIRQVRGGGKTQVLPQFGERHQGGLEQHPERH